MVCSHNFTRLHHFAISFLFIVISTTSHVKLFNAEGRKLEQTPKNSEVLMKEEKIMWRVQIGSKPPRCERRRCGGCGHCEAIQVPTNPQTRNSNASFSAIVEGREDDENSNYKPMSWKCKCGNLVFNP